MNTDNIPITISNKNETESSSDVFIDTHGGIYGDKPESISDSERTQGDNKQCKNIPERDEVDGADLTTTKKPKVEIEHDETSFIETVYGSEHSNDFPSVQVIHSEGQLLTLMETVNAPSGDGSMIDDIPNEILVYTCQPQSHDHLSLFPCKFCGLIVGCIFCLKSHYESIHLNLGLIQYKCNQTTYLRNYTEICNKCQLVSESKEEMIEHRKVHFVTCDVCDMSFDNALFLSNHCKMAHEKFEVIISCDLCEQWFKQLQDLSMHYQEYHEMILCIVCFKRFSNTDELTKHHSTHKIILSDIKPLPYACSKCNQEFQEIYELSAHLVKEHPSRKARYGSIVQRQSDIKAKHKKNAQFNDCGGMRQGLGEECTGKKKDVKKMKKT